MSKYPSFAALTLLAGAQPALAAVAVGNPVGTAVGDALGSVVGVDLSAAVGGALPIGLGGVAAIAGLSLIIGVQLVKRRQK